MQCWLSTQPRQVCHSGMNPEQIAFLPLFVNFLSFQTCCTLFSNTAGRTHGQLKYPETMEPCTLQGGPIQAQGLPCALYWPNKLTADETAEIPPKLTIQESVNTCWHTISARVCQNRYFSAKINKEARQRHNMCCGGSGTGAEDIGNIMGLC